MTSYSKLLINSGKKHTKDSVCIDIYWEFILDMSTELLADNTWEIHVIVIYMYTYLLLVECKVRMASYGSSFFLPFMAQARSARAMKTRKEKRGSITCCTDRANEANKMFIIWLWWLFRY